MVRAMPRHVLHQLKERHKKIDADDFWGFLVNLQPGKAAKMENNTNANKTEADIQVMIKPYRQWSGSQRRKNTDKNDNYYNNNKGSGKGASADGNDYNNNNNDGSGNGAPTGGYYNTNNKGSGKGFTVVQNSNNNKGKGKGKGLNPTPKGKSKGKGKNAFLDGVSFEDAYIPMIEAFSNRKGKHATQIHTDEASMDMDNNVYLGDVATTMVRGMKTRLWVHRQQ